MPRIPQKVTDNELVKRTVPMAGWAYNAMIDEAKREKRDVNAQIALMVERAAIELLKEKKLEQHASASLSETAFAESRDRPNDSNAWDDIESMIGTVEGPSDWSINLDYYLYGTPKRDE